MFRNNRFLIRLILSFLVTGVLLAGLLLLLANTLVAGIIARDNYRSADAQLELSSNTSYYALTDIYGDFYTVWSKDPTIRAALAAVTLSAEERAGIGAVLDSAAFQNSLVHSVCLISEDAGWVISNISPPTSLAGYADIGAIELFHEFETNFQTAKNEVFFPRKASLNLGGIVSSRNYISLIFATPAADGRLHSGIIVNIDQVRLAGLVNTDGANGQMIIVNQSGRVISDLTGAAFAGEFADGELFRDILAGPDEQGNLVRDYAGQSSFIAFKKADTLGFVFLNVMPYDQLMQPVRQTNRIMALLFGAAILLSLIASLFSARKIYRPLSSLIQAMQETPAVHADRDQDEYAYLSAAFGNLVARNEQSSLQRLFQGQGSQQELDVLGFDRPAMMGMILLPDGDDENSHEFLDTLRTIAHRVLRLPAAVWAGDGVAALFNHDQFDDLEKDWIINQLATLQQSVQLETGRTVSIGLGTVAYDLAGVRASLQNALAAAGHARSLGPNQLVPYEEIQTNPAAASQNRTAVAQAVEDYIQANFARPGFSLDEIAEHVGLSAGYMRQIFKLERGVPVNDFIIGTRIRKACELLASSDLTAREISESVGYLDSRYFYTLFKKKTGMTTDEYRRSNRKETQG